ncbi:WD40 repeat-containing protein [Artemisia annua]|uniref:WD40 repeat-containing protein n=1 Tax=Artemisia annua TaxID=35608 RepID=A0A2U1MSD9_ARTAN|nr:WD40 repeat-containing protein [Artemisia annua]
MKKKTAAGRNASLDPRFDKKIPTLDEASCFIAIIVHSISIIDFIDLDLLRLPLSFTNFIAQSISNVYQAMIVLETNERSIVTCAADVQVRHATILECGNVETELLSRHGGRAHKLANEANSPHIFYSCGEAGLVQHFDLRTGEPTQLFTCQPVRAFSYMSVVHLNDIAIDPRNPNLCLVENWSNPNNLQSAVTNRQNRLANTSASLHGSHSLAVIRDNFVRHFLIISFLFIVFVEDPTDSVDGRDLIELYRHNHTRDGVFESPVSEARYTTLSASRARDQASSSELRETVQKQSQKLEMILKWARTQPGFPEELASQATMSGSQEASEGESRGIQDGSGASGGSAGEGSGPSEGSGAGEGTQDNVYQAMIVLETNERSIVTCAADVQVRHATILECGNVETELLSRHGGRAHKLANEANSPHIFYSCGEAGLVQHFDLRTGEPTQLFTCQPVRAFSYMSVVHLNDIAIDPRNPNLCLVGGSDELSRLYDIRKYKYKASADLGEPADYFFPKHLLGDENVGITGLAFSEHSELLVSYAEEFIYGFSKDMGWGNGVTTILADHLTVDSDVEIETDSKPG